MSASERVRQIQAILAVTEDGIPGRLTRGAIDTLFANALAERRGTGLSDGSVIRKAGWSFAVRLDGEDLVVDRTTATYFGGDHDPMDNGETASGVMTRGNPTLIGCALPVLPQVRSTRNSPLPLLPWKTRVRVTCGHRTLEMPLIDNGPARSACDGIDLTIAAFTDLGGDLNRGVLQDVSYRVIGGGRYL